MTFYFDIRWRLLAGPLGGALFSLWLIYFLALWRARGQGEEKPEGEAAFSPPAVKPPNSGISTKTVITPEEYGSASTLPEALKPPCPSGDLEFWSEALRGKFLLKRGTMKRLMDLICEDDNGGQPLSGPEAPPDPEVSERR